MDIPRGFLSSLERHCSDTPGYPDVWKDYGDALALAGRPDDALIALEQALELHPGQLAAQVSYAFVLAELGREQEGFQRFRQALRLDVAPYSATFAFGVFAMGYGWEDVGVQQLTRAAQAAPGHAYRWISLAAARESDQKCRELLDKGRALIRDLPVELDHAPVEEMFASVRRWDCPVRHNVPVRHAMYCTEEGRPDEAERILRVANGEHPGHPELMVAMAHQLTMTGRESEGRAWLDGARQVDPECHRADLDCGLLAMNHERYEEAEACFRRAVQQRPLFPDYRYHLGEALRQHGDLDGALREFQRVLTLIPEHGRAVLQVAACRFAMGQSDLALSVLDGSACAEWPEAMVLAARAHLDRGEPQAAKGLLRQVLEKDPGSESARQVWEQLSAVSS